MKAKAAKETPEQRQQRIRAESQNLRSMQDQLRVRTSAFQRLQSPRVSIATGRSLTGGSLVR